MTVGRTLVPVTMVLATVACAGASLAVAGVPDHPRWWRAAVQLAVLGGIVPMIYAVNIRIVPVFARRAWRSERLLRIQVAGMVAGAWLTFVGRAVDWPGVIVVGQAFALVSGALFVVNIIRLFRSPVGALPPPPLPYPDQAGIDRIATRFMRLASIYLLVGLAIGLATEVHRPSSGRWDLVWAHAMLLGFFLSMASGVCYHVLARWTTRRWRSVRAVRVHYLAVVFGLPFMVAALATDRSQLFYAAGMLQAAALFLFLFNIVTLVAGLPALTRFAWLAAAACLTAGVFLGASFAAHPVLGARMRMAHAEINLFGWAGLLISGAVYYLVPRFAGSRLRWPRAALAQVALLTAGTLGGATVLAVRGYGIIVEHAVVAAQLSIAVSFILLGSSIAGTFLSRQGASISMARPSSRASGVPTTYRPS